MSFAGINYIAVIVATIAGFAVGAVWYSFLFQKPWMAAIGMTEADMKARAGGGGPSLVPLLAGNVLGNLVMAVVLSALIHSLAAASFGAALGVAFLVWLGFVITVMGVNNSFSGRKPALTAIDGGHWLVVLLFMGAILGAFG
jgi:hypothetical protein